MTWSLEDELQVLTHNGNDDMEVAVDVSTMDPHEQNQVLNDVVDAVASDSSLITDDDTYMNAKSLIKHAQHLSGPTLNKLVDCICSGLSTQVEQTIRDNDPTDHTRYIAHKQPLERYMFLLQWFIQQAERVTLSKQDQHNNNNPLTGKRKPKTTTKSNSVTKRNEFIWTDSIPTSLTTMSKTLKLRTERIWQTAPERDAFISNCFLKPVNLLAESEQYMKIPAIKQGIYQIICVAAKSHGQAFSVQMTIMQNLQYSEHLSEPMAELVHLLSKEFDFNRLGEDVLREIASRQFNTQDTKGPKSFSKFLTRLAELSPRLILKQVALLQKHLDSESYPMRNAIIEVIGLLIRELSNSTIITTTTTANQSETTNNDIDQQQQQKQLNSFYELLFERLLDLNSFVRSKVLNVLLKLCDLPSTNPKLRMRLTELVIRSLQDKSSQVRKNSLNVLTRLIETHPFGLHGGELNQTEWLNKFNAIDSELKKFDLPNQIEIQGLQQAQQLMKDSDDEQDESTLKAFENKKVEDDSDDDDEATPKKQNQDQQPNRKKSRPSTIEETITNQSNLLSTVDEETLTRLRLTRQYYNDALNFIELLTKASSISCDLLASTTKGEVLEAMEFFKTASHYKLESAEKGIKRMLHLIWSKDEATTEEDGKELKGIRSRLIECYTQLYFEPILGEQVDSKEYVNRVTQNVIEFTRDATLAELTSLESLLSVMIQREIVQNNVITKLWQVYSTSKTIPKFQRRGSIIVLGMFAISKPQIVAGNVESLLKIGLGNHGKSDLVLAKYTCIALSRIVGSQKKIKGSLEDSTIRLPMDNPLFLKLSNCIKQSSSNKEWFSMTEQAINTIFILGDQPDKLCSEILRDMTRKVFGPKQRSVEQQQQQDNLDDEQQQETSSAVEDELRDNEVEQEQDDETSIPSHGNAIELSQLIFIAGHCAIKQLVHLELVEKDLKRRKSKQDQTSSTPTTTLTGTSTTTTTTSSVSDKTTQDELDQVAGSIEDEIGDTIQQAREKELMFGHESLLSVFGPMSAMIVSQPKIYNNSMLKTAATLALSKFMCVSAQFCEQHLMLLFKVFETSNEPAVRSNIVIALGDIAVCFSTILDQNSDRLYAGLNDKDVTVKKNTLMVLTHLILNGMIKVKGQLGEMAKCLQDKDKRISDLAKLFFTELSTKDKAIYNNLPDIISHLSTGSNGLNEEDFKNSMKFIFNFIDKKKEVETIVEKLCQRFQMSTDERQWRDIAYCLSLLPFNSELSVKKLVEGLPFYQDKLHEEEVFKRFTEILTKAQMNKVTKNEQDLQEFATALEQHRVKGTEEQEMTRKVAKSRKKAAAASTTKGRGKSTRRRIVAQTPPTSDDD
ncbi:condensin complex non-SMC subunit Cnd1 [Microbotryomycetes sp. JL221]|nr:condensin complex non-SMC subunit Cnd1 [Microbotryomycetes sp. JL221]